MQNVNLKLLQTFVLVAQHQSFRMAALASNRTPSAISMQIRALENQIGMRLFNRTPQKVALTADGRVLFDEVSEGMNRIASGVEKLLDKVSKRKGRVTMACAPTLASSRLGNVLAAFRRRYPESVLQLLEAAPAAGLELLAREEVEFYFGPEPLSQTAFDFEKLFDDQIFACIPPEYDVGLAQMSLAQLAQYPILILDKKTELRTLLDQATQEQDLTLNIRCELQSAHSSLSLAASGLGIAVLPSIALKKGETQGIRAVPLTDRRARRAVGLVTARGYVQHSYTEQLLTLVRAAFAQPAEV